MCLVLQTPPGYRLTASDTQRDIERLGRSLRITHDAVVWSPQAFEIRLMMVRQTEPKGAVPPYLYNEHVPEKVVCYDSSASTPNWDFNTKTELEPTPVVTIVGPWDFKTEAELQTDKENRSSRNGMPLPDNVDSAPEAFSLANLILPGLSPLDLSN